MKKLKVFLFLVSVLMILSPLVFAGKSIQPIYWDAITDPDVDQIKVFMYSNTGAPDLDSPAMVLTPIATSTIIENIPNGTWYFIVLPYDNGVTDTACISSGEISKTFEVKPGCASNVRFEEE